MHCEQAEMLLGQYVFDELDAESRAGLEAHLSQCPTCAEKLGDMRVTLNLLTEAVAAEPTPALTDAKRAELLRTIEIEEKKAAKRREKRTPRQVWRGVAVIFTMRRVSIAAASVLLVAGLVGLMMPSLGVARRTARKMTNSDSMFRAYTTAEPRLSAEDPREGWARSGEADRQLASARDDGGGKHWAYENGRADGAVIGGESYALDGLHSPALPKGNSALSDNWLASNLPAGGQTSRGSVRSDETVFFEKSQLSAKKSGGFDPNFGVSQSGVVLDVEGTVSADRRYAQMSNRPNLNTALQPIDTSNSTINGNQSGPVTFTARSAQSSGYKAPEFIEPPKLDLATVRSSVSVPDKSALVTKSESAAESATPSSGRIASYEFAARQQAPANETVDSLSVDQPVSGKALARIDTPPTEQSGGESALGLRWKTTPRGSDSKKWNENGDADGDDILDSRYVKPPTARFSSVDHVAGVRVTDGKLDPAQGLIQGEGQAAAPPAATTPKPADEYFGNDEKGRKSDLYALKPEAPVKRLKEAEVARELAEAPSKFKLDTRYAREGEKDTRLGDQSAVTAGDTLDASKRPASPDAHARTPAGSGVALDDTTRPARTPSPTTGPAPATTELLDASATGRPGNDERDEERAKFVLGLSNGGRGDGTKWNDSTTTRSGASLSVRGSDAVTDLESKQLGGAFDATLRVPPQGAPETKREYDDAGAIDQAGLKITRDGENKSKSDFDPNSAGRLWFRPTHGKDGIALETPPAERPAPGGQPHAADDSGPVADPIPMPIVPPPPGEPATPPTSGTPGTSGYALPEIGQKERRLREEVRRQSEEQAIARDANQSNNKNELEELDKLATINERKDVEDAAQRASLDREVKKAVESVQKELVQDLTHSGDSNASKAEDSDASLPPASNFKAGPVNPWELAASDNLSTFALDVDTASYTLSRNYIRHGFLPPPAAVRMEEFVNAFDYNYPGCTSGVFSVHAEAAPSPFAGEGKRLTLLKVGVRGKVIGRDQRKPAHLVLVVDTSGSMARSDRLPLVKYALSQLTRQLTAGDRVSLVTYGLSSNLVLDSMPATEQATILQAIDSLQANGPTNMLKGLKDGYQVAERAFRPGEVNRVVLCSDGVANVGQTEADVLLENVSTYRKHGVTFSSVGFGHGSYNDVLMERLANGGDGQYVFVDSQEEARHVFVDGLTAALQTIARDAKIQVEFNKERVRRYRLIGYENRAIADADFRNDTVDAGEVGSGQSSTALYELELNDTDGAVATRDLGTVYVRYRNDETEQVEEIAHKLDGDMIKPLTPKTNARFFLAASAAQFAELLRESEHARHGNLSEVQRVLDEVTSALPLDSQARELSKLVRSAQGLPKAP